MHIKQADMQVIPGFAARIGFFVGGQESSPQIACFTYIRTNWQ